MLCEIRNIIGGFVAGRASLSARQAHDRRARYKEVFAVDRHLKQTKTRKTTSISSGNEDCKGVLYPHDDALVMSLLVANYTICAILIDNKSSMDVLFWYIFLEMGIEQEKMCG